MSLTSGTANSPSFVRSRVILIGSAQSSNAWVPGGQYVESRVVNVLELNMMYCRLATNGSKLYQLKGIRRRRQGNTIPYRPLLQP